MCAPTVESRKDESVTQFGSLHHVELQVADLRSSQTRGHVYSASWDMSRTKAGTAVAVGG